jgi:hypothetical protein
MARFFQENIGVSQEMMGGRRRPEPVRNLRATALVKVIMLSWIGPQNLAGITGYNVYQQTETNLVANIPASQYPSSSQQGSNISPLGPPTISFTGSGFITGVGVGFWVSCYTALLESVKTQVIATAS